MMIGCASAPVSKGFMGAVDLNMSHVNAVSLKEGKAENTTFLIFGGQTYPTVYEAARNANITKVATVQYYQKLGVLGLTTKWTTVVTGE